MHACCNNDDASTLVNVVIIPLDRSLLGYDTCLYISNTIIGVLHVTKKKL